MRVSDALVAVALGIVTDHGDAAVQPEPAALLFGIGTAGLALWLFRYRPTA